MGGAPGPQGRRRPRRRRLWTAATVFLPLLLLLAVDSRRPPPEQWSGQALLAGIGLYRESLSPHLARLGVRCRFLPSCSLYAAESIRRHGAWPGLAGATWRLLRCGPWTADGTVDPP